MKHLFKDPHIARIGMQRFMHGVCVCSPITWTKGHILVFTFLTMLMMTSHVKCFFVCITVRRALHSVLFNPHNKPLRWVFKIAFSLAQTVVKQFHPAGGRQVCRKLPAGHSSERPAYIYSDVILLIPAGLAILENGSQLKPASDRREKKKTLEETTM